MEQQIVNHIVSTDSFRSLDQKQKQNIQKELLRHFTDLSITATELGININELWKVYLAKCEYNKFDLREQRHVMNSNHESKVIPSEHITMNINQKVKVQSRNIMQMRRESKIKQIERRNTAQVCQEKNVSNAAYTNQEEKVRLIEQNKDQLKDKYIAESLQTPVHGYDMNTQQIRQINRETEYLLAFFQNEEHVKMLSEMVPPYIKFKIFKCSDVSLVDIPNQCADKFPGLFLLIVPKRKTVMIGLGGYSPHIENVGLCQVGGLQIAFIDATLAEQIDDEHANKFWFFENYSPKRGYHVIYSNSRTPKVQAAII